MFFITMVPLDVINISLEVNFRIFITADRTSWYTTVVVTLLWRLYSWYCFSSTMNQKSIVCLSKYIPNLHNGSVE